MKKRAKKESPDTRREENATWDENLTKLRKYLSGLPEPESEKEKEHWAILTRHFSKRITNQVVLEQVTDLVCIAALSPTEISGSEGTHTFRAFKADLPPIDWRVTATTRRDDDLIDSLAKDLKDSVGWGASIPFLIAANILTGQMDPNSYKMRLANLQESESKDALVQYLWIELKMHLSQKYGDRFAQPQRVKQIMEIRKNRNL